jgi:hypothetical protein
MHALLAGLTLLSRPIHKDLVADVRAALHVDAPAWKSTLITGKATFYSEPGAFAFQFESGGKFLQTITGPLGESYGCDGSNYWELDRSGAPRLLNFEDKDLQQAFLLVQNDGWLSPPEGVTVKANGNQIHITLESGLDEVLDIDPATSLPTGATLTASPGTISIKLSNWQSAGEWKLPLKAEVTTGGLTDTFEGDKVSEAPSPAYSEPKWVSNNIAFNTSIPAIVEAKKLPTGHIIVHPLVNGKDVGWFILDSGADIVVIDPKIADDLKLPKVGKLPLVGVGGVTTESFRTIDDLKLGPATLKNTDCAEYDLSVFKRYFGVEVAGIIGFDMFRRTIISVDLDKPTVALYDPATFKLPAGDWTPTLFSTGNMALQAKMEGDRTGWYRLDTGAQGTVQFHAPYVQKEHLLQGRTTSMAQEGGAGGTSEARAGKIAWFELAGHRFENPDVVFSQATIGAFNDKYLAGNIGQEFMLPFTVYFDFGGSRVALAPKS